jgi:anti-sigma regulatory factor (Ser/Thr protein kinase)
MFSMRHFVFSASYAGVDRIADRLLDALPEEERTARVRIGVVEALANAILHGALRVPERGGLDDLPEFLESMDRYDSAEVTLWAGVGARVIAIYDGGPGFDWRSALRRPGRGLSIMRHVFGAVEWNDAGNCVLLHLAALDADALSAEPASEADAPAGASTNPSTSERPRG